MICALIGENHTVGISTSFKKHEYNESFNILHYIFPFLQVKSPIGILWTLLSIVVAGTCSFSFLQPHWFVEPDTENSFGMFSYCIATSESPYSTYQTRSHRQMHIRTDISRAARKQNCGIYGGSFQFSNLPSNSWQASCVLYGGGCVFLCFGALLAIIALCVPTVTDKRLTMFSGYIQTMASKYTLSVAKVSRNLDPHRRSAFFAHIRQRCEDSVPFALPLTISPGARQVKLPGKLIKAFEDQCLQYF